MTTLVRWLDHPVAEALGWALLQFVWQGALVAAGVAILLMAMKRATPRARYLVLCGGLVVMAACPIATFCWILRSIEPTNPPAIVGSTPVPELPLRIVDQPRLGPMVVEDYESEDSVSGFLMVAPEPDPIPQAETPPSQINQNSLKKRMYLLVERLLPSLVSAWLIGVLALSLRLLAGWRLIRRLQRTGVAVNSTLWQERLSRLAARLRVRTPVTLVQSAFVEVPTVIGWLKPMILLPATALTGLEPPQLEALLAHELAHIRRHDYLVNLLQTVIETLLFYHPAVWWLSRRIRQEREHCCDDLAVAVCGDTLIYARALATMEELRAGPVLTLAANDGSLLARIRRIVSRSVAKESPAPRFGTPSGLIVLSLAVIGLTALLATAYPRQAAEENAVAETAGANEPAGMNDAVLQAADKAAEHLARLNTGHFRLRRTHQPAGKPLTAEECAALLAKYDLTDAEQHEDFLREFSAAELPAGRPLWSDYDFHFDQGKTRETQWLAGETQEVRIVNDGLLLCWNEANSQVKIDPLAESRYGVLRLSDLYSPQPRLTPEKLSQLAISKEDGRITLKSLESPQGDFSTLVVDAATGFLLSSSRSHRTQGIVEEQQWGGWDRALDGTPFPRYVVKFRYQNQKLGLYQVDFIRQARFNIPLDPTVFQLSAPAGSVILDSRKDHLFRGTINRELFDVTSADQRAEAAKPVSGELTPLEQAAVEELKKLYALPDGEVLKFIGPPFPASRRLAPRLWSQKYEPPRRKTRFDLIAWNHGTWERSFNFTGLAPKLSDLIGYFLKVQQPDIVGEAKLLQRELPGDFVSRADASVEDLAAKLGEIAQQEWQIPVRLVFREVERTVYVARGEFQSALPEGARLALNSGPYAGDHGEIIHNGSPSDLLTSAAEYIGVKIVNEAAPSSARLEWSRRWYDRSDVAPEKRFRIDPQTVLRQITEQTGLTFTEEKRMLRVLFVETDELPAATSDAAPQPIKATPGVETIQFQLKGFAGATFSATDGKSNFALPGRWALPFSETESSTAHFRITNIPEYGKLVVDGTVSYPPRQEQPAAFLAAGVVPIDMNMDVMSRFLKGGGLRDFYFVPHQPPGMTWDGNLAVLTMGGTLSAEDRSMVMTNLGRRGVFVAEVHWDSHSEADEVPPKPLRAETERNIELLKKIAAANKASHERLLTWKARGSYSASLTWEDGPKPHSQRAVRSADIAFALNQKAGLLKVDWEEREPVRLFHADGTRGRPVTASRNRFQSIVTKNDWFDLRTAKAIAIDEVPLYAEKPVDESRVMVQHPSSRLTNSDHESEGMIDPRRWTSLDFVGSRGLGFVWELTARLMDVHERNRRKGLEDTIFETGHIRILPEQTADGLIVRIQRDFHSGREKEADPNLMTEFVFAERYNFALTQAERSYGDSRESKHIAYEMRGGIPVPIRFQRNIRNASKEIEASVDVEIAEFEINELLDPAQFESASLGLQDGDRVLLEPQKKGFVIRNGRHIPLERQEFFEHEWDSVGNTSLKYQSYALGSPFVNLQWNDLVRTWVDLSNSWEKTNLDKLPAAERKRAYEENRAAWEKLARRYVALHPSYRRQAPKHLAFECLTQALRLQYAGSVGDEAAELLLREHAGLFTEDQQTLAVMLGYSFPSSLASETVLRALAEKSQSRATQAQARMSLARFLADRAQQKRMIDALPARAERVADEYGPWYLDRIRQLDPDAAEQEAESLWRNVIDHFSDVVDKSPQQEKLAAQAQRDLLRQQHAIGRRAPEIAGGAGDGRPLKLSETDGKVRVLIFWGHWCGPCRRHYPYLRQLMAKHADQPFEVLGICSDENQEAIQKPVDAGEITWRYWWDGDDDRWRIHKEWGLYGAAWIFVLDHKGIVRFAEANDSELEPAVELLLREQREQQK